MLQEQDKNFIQDIEEFEENDNPYTEDFNIINEKPQNICNFHQSFDTFEIPECRNIQTQENFANSSIMPRCKQLDNKNIQQEKEFKILRKSEKEKGKKKKKKTNSFALGRTCFRGMSNYFKNKFDLILKQWEKDLNSNVERPTMEKLVSDYIRKEFNSNEYSSNLSGFVDCMITILHSQNHKKNDSYIQKRDFKIIRSLLYCYSSTAKKTFISNNTYAIIFQRFFKNSGDEFLNSKAKGKYPEFKDELKNELEDIYSLSLKTTEGSL